MNMYCFKSTFTEIHISLEGRPLAMKNCRTLIGTLYKTRVNPTITSGKEKNVINEPVFFSLQVGDRVVAFQRSGSFAEAIAVPTKFVYEMPNKMTYEEGAAMGLCYAVAYMMLYEIANLTKGKSVLVHSAGGGVVSVCENREKKRK